MGGKGPGPKNAPNSDEQSAPQAATVYAPVDQQALAQAEAQVAAEWQVGETLLDLYEVTGLLGEGGMGKVYKVHHKGWNTDLAVKSPRSEIFSTAGGKENFIREAETWVNLGLHPHTVSCYYVRTLGDIPRVFAEYVEGGSLQDWIRTRKLYEGGPEKALERVLDIAIQFAWGLDYAHERGLVHQDVKPANVMMTADGTAKVTDFGLAKARGLAGEREKPTAAGGSILVSTGGMTREYCSPEQAARKALTRATDVWSWGLSVLEMFTGEVTWMAGQAAAEALESYLEMGADDAAIPQMPEAVAALLEKCFAHDPEARPHTMRDIGESLREIYEPLTGKPYARPEPKAAELTADSLNNQALSLLDLGAPEEAEKRWEEALQADPLHSPATYNRGLALWRGGRITDSDLVRALEAIKAARPEDGVVEYLLGLVHIERGDSRLATATLDLAGSRAKSKLDVESALEVAKSVGRDWPCCVQSFQGMASSLVALTGDAHLLVLATQDETLLVLDTITGNRVATLRGYSGKTISAAASDIGTWGVSAHSGAGLPEVRVWDLSKGGCLAVFPVPGFSQHPWKHTPFVRAFLSEDRTHVRGVWRHNEDPDDMNESTLFVHSLSDNRSERYLVNAWANAPSVCPQTQAFLLGEAETQTFGPHRLRLRDSAGNILIEFAREYTRVTATAITPDGEKGASGELNGRIRIWNARTGSLCHEFHGHVGPVMSLAFVARQTSMVSAGADGLLRLWDVSSGKCIRTFTDCSGKVLALAASGDGSACVTTEDSGSATLWRVGDTRLPAAEFLVCRPRSVEELGARNSMQRELLATASRSLEEGDFHSACASLQRAREVEDCGRTPSLRFLERKMLRSLPAQALLSAWCVGEFAGHTERVCAAMFLGDDGQQVVSGAYDESLIVWNVETRKQEAVAKTNHHEWIEGFKNGITGLGYLQTVHVCVASCLDGSFVMWKDPPRGEAKVTEAFIPGGFGLPMTRMLIGAFPTESHLLVAHGSLAAVVALPDLATVHELAGHVKRILAGAVSPDGRQAVTAGEDKDLAVWEVTTGRRSATVPGHRDEVFALAWSADGKQLVSASWDGEIRVWETSGWSCVRTLSAPSRVLSMALSPDARFLLTGDTKGYLHAWDLGSGKVVFSARAHADAVGSLTFSADRRYALTASYDRLVKVWEFQWDPDPSCRWSHWDEGARPYLENFLRLHTPCVTCDPTSAGSLIRQGTPVWREEDFDRLIQQLQHAGYGWLRPEGVRKKLEEMAANWQGPPPLPGT